MAGDSTGVWVGWYESGERFDAIVYPILGGYGKHTGWFPNGDVRFEVNLFRGQYHGHCVWKSAANRDSLDGFYFNGKLIADLAVLRTDRSFYRGGRLLNSTEQLWIEWDAWMENVWIGKKEGDKRVGIWTRFFPNGDVGTEQY